MSKKDSQFQKRVMSLMFRGKEIFKPLNTGWIDEHVACVREWIANIFFYTKNGTTIMIDAGYNYDRLKEKMSWLDIEPSSIRHILITHQDTDHVGAVETDSDGLFRNATLYLSEIENRYLTGEKRRKVIFGLYKLPMVKSDNRRVLLQDGQILNIGSIRVECILVPGHTWGHMVYLIDNEYLFTGDTIWFGANGGYSFINSLAEDNELAKKSLRELDLLEERAVNPAETRLLRLAQATVGCALFRRESRGSHRRTDYPEIRSDFQKQTVVKFKEIFYRDIPELRSHEAEN